MSRSEGTYIKPRYPLIYFDDIHSTSINGVEEEQRECQQNIMEIREKLAMLIAGNPKDMMTDDDVNEYGTTTNWIKEQLDEIEESLQDALRKSGRLEVYEQLLYEWEDSVFCDKEYESIYDDVNFYPMSPNSKKIVFPEEEFVNNTNDKMMVAIGAKLAKETSFDELFANGMANVDLEENNRKIVENLVFAVIDKKLFTTYTGQWLFKDEANAMKAISHKLNISIMPFVNIKYISQHPEFYSDSVFKYLETEDIDFMIEYVAHPENLGSIMSEQYNKFFNLTQKAYNNFLHSKIKFVKVSEIIN